MQTIVMQDWITIQGGASTNVAMSQSDWLLTAAFQDITFYFECRAASASVPSIQYETAPGRDEQLFVAMGANTAVATGVAAPKTFYTANADAPVSHWARWKLVAPGSAWNLTFRIMAAGNSIS